MEQLPLVLVVANNQYAYSTPNDRQFACDDLVDKAVGYGVDVAYAWMAPIWRIACNVLSTAVARAREGGGPQMVVGRLLRLCGHGEHDDAHYIDAQLKKSPLGRDCLKVAEERLLREGLGRRQGHSTPCARKSTQEVDEAVATVQREPAPDPYKENWCALASRHLSELFETRRRAGSHEHHLSGGHSRSPGQGAGRDPRVFIYGQDVGAFGGAFKATKNLAQRISRPGALTRPSARTRWSARPSARPSKGCGPIIEMQFADFSTPGFNQIVNQAATLYWRTQRAVPDHHSPALRRHFRRRPVSQPEHGGALRALSRA